MAILGILVILNSTFNMGTTQSRAPEGGGWVCAANHEPGHPPSRPPPAPTPTLPTIAVHVWRVAARHTFTQVVGAAGRPHDILYTRPSSAVYQGLLRAIPGYTRLAWTVLDITHHPLDATGDRIQVYILVYAYTGSRSSPFHRHY